MRIGENILIFIIRFYAQYNCYFIYLFIFGLEGGGVNLIMYVFKYL